MPYQRTLQQQIAKTLLTAHRNDPSLPELLHLVDESNKHTHEAGIYSAEKNIDLRQLLSNIKAFNCAKADARGNTIRLVIDPTLPPYIIGNVVRLYQVFDNVVTNAIKCTHDGLITVSLQLRHMNEQQVTVQFSVSYNILHTPPSQESSFHFTFTFKKGADSIYKEWDNVQLAKDLGGIRVLLVEDVEYNIMIAEKMLTGWNATVDIAMNGVEAIAKTRMNKYDVVLMDLQMPVMDGYSATRHIRNSDKLIPIIALTAYSTPDLLSNDDCGLTDLLAKPFKPPALYDIVYKYTHGKNRLKQ